MGHMAWAVVRHAWRLSVVVSCLSVVSNVRAAADAAIPAAEAGGCGEVLLDDCASMSRWRYHNGGEFPGAKGGLEKDPVGKGLKLSYDFGGGGSYVGAGLYGAFPPAADVARVALTAQGDCMLFFRLVDSRGRTYQWEKQKRVAGQHAVLLSMTAGWSGAWGGPKETKADSAPLLPVKELWMCVANADGVAKLGAVTLTSVSVGSSKGVIASTEPVVGEDFSCSFGGWRVTGTWGSHGWRNTYLRVGAEGGAAPAELALDLPAMGRHKVFRLHLEPGKTESAEFSPGLPNGGNPRNTYQIALSLSVGREHYERIVVLRGVESDKTDFGAPKPSSSIERSKFGTCVHFSHVNPADPHSWPEWRDYQWFVDRIAGGGIKWIRDGIRTDKSAEGTYTLNPHDVEWARYAKSKGLRILCVISMNAHEPVDEFVARCEALAERTRDLVDAFELGNEPNNFGGWLKKYGGTWNGKEEDNSTSGWVKEHLKSTNAGAVALKKIRPETPVVGLGACSPTNFRYLDLGVSPALDGVVDHPYPYCMPPEKIPYGWGMEKRDGVKVGDANHTLEGLVRSYHEKFAATGAPRQLWFTEFGFSTFLFDGEKTEKCLYAGFSEEAQAVYIARGYLLSSVLPVEAIFQYDFTDDYHSVPRDAEANFGMWRADRSPKPSYGAVTRICSLLAGYEADAGAGVSITAAPLHRGMERTELVRNWDDTTLTAENGVRAHAFTSKAKPTTRMLAVWSQLPFSKEHHNRVATIKLTGWKDFGVDAVAIDLIDGSTFDAPVKREGDDLVLDRLFLGAHPLMISFQSSGSRTKEGE